MGKISKCKWCGKKINSEHVKTCFECWQLFYRIEERLDVAENMIKKINKKKKK